MSAEIRSVDNPRIRHYVRIVSRGRLPDGTPVLPLEGPRLLEEALAAGWCPVMAAITPKGEKADPLRSLNTPAFRGSEVLLVAPHVYKKLSKTETPQEPLLLVKPPETFSFPAAGPEAEDDESLLPLETNRLVVADGVQDPGNLGTILRSARAFGFDTVVTTPGAAGLASPKVLRASAGALFRCRCRVGVPVPDLVRLLRRRGFLVVVLDARGDVSMERLLWKEPVAIVTGGEAQGPSEDWRGDQQETPHPGSRVVRVRIPTVPECESLNTAGAATLALHAASQALFPLE